MGDYNKTCMLSHLPITEGTGTKVIFLNTFGKDYHTPSNSSGSIYPEDFIMPLFFPVEATYNGDGTFISFKKDWNYNLIEATLKDSYWRARRNDGYNVEVSVKEFINNMAPGFAVNFLYASRYVSPELSITYIRKDVWDLVKYKYAHYVMKGGTIQSHFIKEWEQGLKMFERIPDKTPEMFGNLLHDVFTMNSNHMHYGGLYGEEIYKCSEEEREQIFNTHILPIKIISHFMMMTRRQWHVTSGALQDDDLSLHKILLNTINKIIEDNE